MVRMGPETATVRYTLAGATAGVEVDGQDISKLLSRFTIDHHAGALPHVFLELQKTVAVDEIECQAVVHVIREVPADEIAAVRRWLEPIDADEFEKAVLAAMELGGPQTFGAAALEVLRKWVTPDGD